MTTTIPLHFRATVSNRGEAGGFLKAPGDAVLIERGRPRSLLLSCPCGCGEEFPINLDARIGPAWRIYRSNSGGFSVYPSVWRESGCKSHYIIWRDQILLFGQYDDGLYDTPSLEKPTKLADSVRELLPIHGLKSFSEIADALEAVPWDVLMVCRQLVYSGEAWEGVGDQRGSFGKK